MLLKLSESDLGLLAPYTNPRVFTTIKLPSPFIKFVNSVKTFTVDHVIKTTRGFIFAHGIDELYLRLC